MNSKKLSIGNHFIGNHHYFTTVSVLKGNSIVPLFVSSIGFFKWNIASLEEHIHILNEWLPLLFYQLISVCTLGNSTYRRHRSFHPIRHSGIFGVAGSISTKIAKTEPLYSSKT